MKKIKNNIEVTEVPYDDLVSKVDEVEKYQLGYQPPKKKKNESPYPFTMKVHCWTLKDTEDFCKCIERYAIL